MHYTITTATADDTDVAALLVRHMQMMQAESPPESCHVMDPAALVGTGAVLLAARAGDRVLGVGALKPLDAQHGELKSMHTAAEARGKGIAQALVRGLIDMARTKGLHRLSLETGTTRLFAPARALYAAQGFKECPPFGDYHLDPLSVFMTRTI
ncbi:MULTISPECIES: GNAT family N-acetyltransferase [Roseobacteraceae]|uniref:Putative N-acetyltransferase YsnE n=1 Tax=Pseudosulfitobacter pseudonitzschiae TaxID=1402135 RepID=A0A221JWH0_9RHOB|nr:MULTISPECIES: GNAT family N-acetyltransferase [Roseobacteraceae]ASM71043.1 putative N-acetyltransferase YsnE [Pseudosulfitobacter pseudonitzschiae]